MTGKKEKTQKNQCRTKMCFHYCLSRWLSKAMTRYLMGIIHKHCHGGIFNLITDHDIYQVRLSLRKRLQARFNPERNFESDFMKSPKSCIYSVMVHCGKRSCVAFAFLCIWNDKKCFVSACAASSPLTSSLG